METKLQIAFAIQFAVYGITHLFRPGPLIQFYGVLASKGEGGVVFIALLGLCTGAFVVAFHNIWTGIPIVLTISGWMLLLKGIAYFLFPTLGLQQIERVTPDRTNPFRMVGIPFLVISVLLVWHVMSPTALPTDLVSPNSQCSPFRNAQNALLD